MTSKFVPVEDEILQVATPAQRRAILAYNETGSYTKAAAKVGITRASLTNLLKRAKRRASFRGHSPEHDMTHMTPETHLVKGTSSLYDGDGNLKLQWVKTRLDEENLEQYLQDFADEVSKSVKPISPVAISKSDFSQDLATCYIIGDAHFAMQSFELETGVEDYDLDKGISDFELASGYLVRRAERSDIGVIVNVGDLLHCNDDKNETPASGNKLDASHRISITARKVARAMRTLIGRALRKHREVWVVNARGNHDPDAAVWVNVILETAYENEPRVKIIPNTQKICHFVFGDVFVPVWHGDRSPASRIYERITSGRFREIFGRAKHTYVWSGHIHHETVKPIGGAKFETFNSLVPPDKFHADSAYGADRSMTAITLHKQFGDVGRDRCSIELARSLG